MGLSQILSISVQQSVLRQYPLFKGMSNYQIRKAILISELAEFNMGDFIAHEGEFARSMFLVLKGKVQIVKKDSGECQPVAVLEAGDTFGKSIT